MIAPAFPALVCVLKGGPDHAIVAGGKRWFFEMHPYCGPVLLDKRTGDPRDTQPPEQCPFWEAVQQWDKQGRRVGDDGLCIWTPEPTPILQHLGGKNYLIVGYENKDAPR